MVGAKQTHDFNSLSTSVETATMTTPQNWSISEMFIDRQFSTASHENSPCPHRFRPSVCIDAVFGELSVDQAIAAVAETGIAAFEFWGWWDKDLDLVRAARDRHSLEISACCTKFISLVDPQSREDYLAGMVESIEASPITRVPNIDFAGG